MSVHNRIVCVLVFVVATFGSGCATYVRDRVADAGDIFTATVGAGIGVTAKAGPIHTGFVAVSSAPSSRTAKQILFFPLPATPP